MRRQQQTTRPRLWKSRSLLRTSCSTTPRSWPTISSCQSTPWALLSRLSRPLTLMPLRKPQKTPRSCSTAWTIPTTSLTPSRPLTPKLWTRQQRTPRLCSIAWTTRTTSLTRLSKACSTSTRSHVRSSTRLLPRSLQCRVISLSTTLAS